MQNLTIMSVKGEKLAFTTSIIFLKGISSITQTLQNNLMIKKISKILFLQSKQTHC